MEWHFANLISKESWESHTKTGTTMKQPLASSTGLRGGRIAFYTFIHLCLTWQHGQAAWWTHQSAFYINDLAGDYSVNGAAEGETADRDGRISERWLLSKWQPQCSVKGSTTLARLHACRQKSRGNSHWVTLAEQSPPSWEPSSWYAAILWHCALKCTH